MSKHDDHVDALPLSWINSLTLRRWQELAKQAGMNSLAEEALLGYMQNMTEEGRLVHVNRLARDLRPGNNFEKLLALAVAERLKS